MQDVSLSATSSMDLLGVFLYCLQCWRAGLVSNTKQYGRAGFIPLQEVQDVCGSLFTPFGVDVQGTSINRSARVGCISLHHLQCGCGAGCIPPHRQQDGLAGVSLPPIRLYVVSVEVQGVLALPKKIYRLTLYLQRRWTWTGDFKCREVKTGFYRNKSMQTGSSGTLIGWKSGQTTFVPLWDWMEGAWLRTQQWRR